MMSIGVLALQGAYDKHVQILQSIGCNNVLVRSVADLESCDGLIIPGGESTTMTQLMRRYDMIQPLQTFAQQKPLFGTCAGLIMMAEQVDDPRVDNLQALPLTIRRNAYGRQAESFHANVALQFDTSGGDFPGVFIRAPIIEKMDSSVEILATCQNNPVLVAKGHHLAASFHPELTQDDRIHRYWLDRIAV